MQRIATSKQKRDHFPHSTNHIHPHFFQQLNDNLKIRYLGVKQRVNGSDNISLDQKKKSLEQTSKGYLELRELTKELQFVCLKQDVCPSFTQAYESVLTCQQLSLTKIKQILTGIKVSLEDKSSYFHIIMKEMARRQEAMRKITHYLKKFQELHEIRGTREYPDAIINGMPILKDLIGKAIERLIEYRDNTLNLLQVLSDWKQHLNSILITDEDEQRQKILNKAYMQFNGINILEVIADETVRISETPLRQLIRFKEDSANDPLFLHPYKINNINQETYKPLSAFFVTNRKYLQRLTKSDQFFKGELHNYRSVMKNDDAYPEYQMYSQIFSEKFYKKTIKRNNVSKKLPILTDKQYETDGEEQRLLPYINKMEDILESPKPREKSKKKLKAGLPNFRRFKTEAQKLDEQMKEVISNYMSSKKLMYEQASLRDIASQDIRLEPIKPKHITLNNNVLSVKMGGGEEPKLPEISKNQKSPATKKTLSLYKYDIMCVQSTARGKSPEKQIDALKSTKKAFEKLSPDVSPIQSSPRLASPEQPNTSSPIQQLEHSRVQTEPAQLQTLRPADVGSLNTPKPIQTLPEPQSQVAPKNTNKLELHQALIHDWQLKEFIQKNRRKYCYENMILMDSWQNFYIYQLREGNNPIASLISRRLRNNRKRYALDVVFMSAGSMQAMEHLIKQYKKKITIYESVETVLLIVSKVNNDSWLKDILVEALFQESQDSYTLELKALEEAKHKFIVEIQLSALLVNVHGSIQLNLESEGIEAFSRSNFDGEGITESFIGEIQKYEKKTSKTKQIYYADVVHTRKCQSLRQINNFLEAYDMEPFDEPEFGNKPNAPSEIIVGAVNEGCTLPFPYAVIPQQNSENMRLSYLIFKNCPHGVQMHREHTVNGDEQICLIKLQKGLWAYFYKCDDEAEMMRLPVYWDRVKGKIKKTNEFKKCLIELCIRQLYGKLPLNGIDKKHAFGSLTMSIDEDDITYGSVIYNLSHKDMVYFYLPYVFGICIEGKGQKYPICETYVPRQE